MGQVEPNAPCARQKARLGWLAGAMIALAALGCGAPATPVAESANPAPMNADQDPRPAPAPPSTPSTPAAAKSPSGPAALRPVRPEALVLTKVEAQLVAEIDARTSDAVKLLERVVNINSGTMNLAGVRAVGQVFANEFEALGFETEWVPQDHVGRAGHLFARRRGTQGKRLLLIGHLDTVFEPDSPFQKFELLGEGMARGPGVADMKGGNVVILYALIALNAVGALDDTTITVALMGDEELTGDPLSESRKSLIEAAQASDIALGFEGGATENSATLGRRGFTDWSLEVTARSGHSSAIFSDAFGAGAIYEAARILSAFYDHLRGELNVTFSAGLILGGTTITHDAAQDRGTAFGKSNVIPESAIVTGDLRTLTIDQRERAKAKMRAIAARNLPQTSVTLRFRDSYPPMTPTDASRRLLVELDEVGRALDFPELVVIPPGRRGAADISFAALHVEAALAGLGAVGSGAHTERERLEVDSLYQAAYRTAVFVYRLTR